MNAFEQTRRRTRRIVTILCIRDIVTACVGRHHHQCVYYAGTRRTLENNTIIIITVVGNSSSKNFSVNGRVQSVAIFLSATRKPSKTVSQRSGHRRENNTGYRRNDRHSARLTGPQTMTVTRYFTVDSVVQPVQPAAGPVRNATAAPATVTVANRIPITGYDDDNGYDDNGGRGLRQFPVTAAAAAAGGGESQSAPSPSLSRPSSPSHVLEDGLSLDLRQPARDPVSVVRRTADKTLSLRLIYYRYIYYPHQSFSPLMSSRFYAYL